MGMPTRDIKKTDDETDDDEGVHRLSDIRSKEVSLVDRGANKKRRFLVVKKDQEMSGPASTDQNPEAGNTPATDANTPTTPPDAGNQPAGDQPEGAQPAAEDPSNPSAGSAASGSDPAPEGGEGGTGDDAGAGDGGEGETGDEPAAVSEEVVKALASVSDKIKALSTSGDMADVQVGLLDLGDMLKSLSEGKVLTDKAGAGLRRDRLVTLERAVKTLMNLVNELKGKKSTKKDDTPATPAQTPVTPAQPESQANTEIMAMLKGIKTDVSDMKSDLGKTSEGLAGLTRVVDTQGKRVEKISKNYGGGNQEPFDGDNGAPAIDQVSWPLDMNSPQKSRAELEKRGTSFYPKD